MREFLLQAWCGMGDFGEPQMEYTLKGVETLSSNEISQYLENELNSQR